MANETPACLLYLLSVGKNTKWYCRSTTRLRRRTT
jgi:hypothetical protein